MDAATLSSLLGRPVEAIRVASTGHSYIERIVEEEVSPEQAMRWIAATWVKYPSGRNFYPTQIEKIIDYAHAMTNGEWAYCPDGDSIDITDGTITGGRHRLHAILLSHTTQKCNVRYRTKKEL